MKTPAEEKKEAPQITDLIFTPPPQDPVVLVTAKEIEFLDRVEEEAERTQVFDAKSYEELGKKQKAITTTINALKKAKTEKRKPFVSIADEISDGIEPTIKRLEAVKVILLDLATKYAQAEKVKELEAQRQARVAQEAAELVAREKADKDRREALEAAAKKVAEEKTRLEKEAADAIANGEDPFADTIFDGEPVHEEIEILDGLIWIGGVHLDAPQADAIARANGEQWAEAFVKKYNGQTFKINKETRSSIELLTPTPSRPAPRPVAAAPMIAKPAAVKAKGLRTMDKPRYNILNEARVPREYLMVNEAAIREAVNKGILKPDNPEGTLTVIDGWIEVEIKLEVVGGR